MKSKENQSDTIVEKALKGTIKHKDILAFEFGSNKRQIDEKFSDYKTRQKVESMIFKLRMSYGAYEVQTQNRDKKSHKLIPFINLDRDRRNKAQKKADKKMGRK